MDDNVVNFGSGKIIEAPKPDNGPKIKLYDFHLIDGTSIQGSGVLMITGAFFAAGVPTPDGSGVNFTVAAPIDKVQYVIETKSTETI